MTGRINRAIEQLEQDHAVYYTGAHTGHVAGIGREAIQRMGARVRRGTHTMGGLYDFVPAAVEASPCQRR